MVDCADLLQSTFAHLRGITLEKEKALWNSGITDIDALNNQYFSKQIQLFNDEHEQTKATKLALSDKNADFFATHLPSQELYRIALSYYSDVIFLDIETTGLSKHYSYITIVGWEMGNRYKYFVKGQSPTELLNDLKRAKAIVTFNGSLFDLPFLRKELPEITIPQTHIDLRFFSRRFGYAGGQKIIEKMLNINRPLHVGDVDGKEAVVLWYKYLSGDLPALEKLIQYNYYDIAGMQGIFDAIVKKSIASQWKPITRKPLYSFASHPKDINVNVTQDLYEETKKIIVDRTAEKMGIAPINGEVIRAIGIDLTGSEERATGCCYLENTSATTCLINTDKELLSYVLKHNPTIVSIDSPLSLPKGRNSVFDDDEGRNTYGIMRFCERALKKRGVNVYPSLIKSMQNLTARGIRLAAELRAKGIPVIESFPGAAQDVLRIPRKRTDLFFLKQGLINFGIIGEYQEKSISHDELDAITSALVGLLFWKGRFEALGIEEENYLIIPELKSNAESIWGRRKIVGFSGPIATGKTFASKYLESKGYHYIRFSAVLKELLEQENVPVNRHTLQQLGSEIYQEQKQYWLCKQVAKRIPATGNVVIDGLRHPEDHAFFTEYFGPDFIHIYIDTKMKVRKERYMLENNADEFDHSIKHPSEKDVPMLKKMAHLIKQNNLDAKTFIEKIDQILK